MKKALSKPRLLSYLILGVCLAVTMLSALYTLFLLLSELSCEIPAAILFSCLTLLGWLSAFYLASRLRSPVIYGFGGILWLLCTLAWGLFAWLQATGLLTDSVFAFVLSIFSFPVWAFMPLVYALSFGSDTVRLTLSLIVSALFTALPFLLWMLSRRSHGDAAL